MNIRMIGRGLLFLTCLSLGGFLVWRLLTLYEGQWASFLRPTRAFLRAAAARDSSKLRRLGAPPAVIRRTLETAAKHPEQFAALAELRVITGQRAGDTTHVTFFHAPCSAHVLVLTFRGSGSKTRVQDITLPCAGQ